MGNSGSHGPSMLKEAQTLHAGAGHAEGITWMILESSSNEFLQSPQYSCASCRMYLFTLAEVELIPPLPPESSWRIKEGKRS